MGFASAFASGLVKGFNQNIINEQQKRAKEEAKLDGYEAMIFKTAMEGGDDVNTSAINRISELVKGGRKQLEEQGGIDIFGRPGKRLKLDMLNTAGIVNNTNSTTRIGGVQMPVLKAFNDKTIRGDTSKRASVFFDSVNKLGPEKISAMFRGKDLEAFQTAYRMHANNFIAKDVMSKDGNNLVRVMTYEDQVPGYKDLFKSLVERDSEYKVAIGALGGNKQLPEGSFILPMSLRTDPNAKGMDGILTTLKEMNLDGRQSELKGLAGLHGYNDVGEFMYYAASNYNDKSKFMNGLDITLDLYGMNAHDPKSQKNMAEIGKYLVEKAKVDDPIMRAYLLAPLIHNKDNLRLDKMRGYGFKQALNDSDFNGQFKKFTGVKLDDFQKNYKALARSENQITTLLELTKGADFASGTFQQKLFTFFDGIFGKTGGIDQVKSFVGNGSDDDETKSVAIRIQNHMQKIEDAYGKNTPEGIMQARIATLKFVVAADLARAEDSQGRLSDQDLARNMAKLGTGLGTKENQMAAMTEVLKDVSMKRNSMLMLDKLIPNARNRGYFNRKERALFAADELSRKYVQEYNRRGGTSYESEKRLFTIEEVMNPEIFELEPDLQGNKGEQIYTSSDSNTQVLVRDGKVIEQFSGADNITNATKQGFIQYKETIEFGGVVGSDTGFYPPQPLKTNEPEVNKPKGVPEIKKKDLPVGQSGETVSGSQLGVNNFEDLKGKLNPDGVSYNLNGKNYKLISQDPFTFKEI